MSRPVAPALTVRYDGSQRTFAAGHDVVVGRDLRADVRIAHPLISRAHVLLRFDHDRWVAIDNGSLNGLFVNGRRLPAVDVNDGLAVNIGNPDGPLLRFEVGHATGSVGRPPQTTSHPATDRTTVYPPPPRTGPTPGSWSPPPHISRPQPAYPSASQPSQPPQPSYRDAPAPAGARRAAHRVPLPTAAGNVPTQMGPTAIPPRSGGSGDGSNLATSMLKILRPGKSADVPEGSIKIGRATDNDIVIPDVLASRHHATLVPSATGGHRDPRHRSINGTFVNGQRVGRGHAARRRRRHDRQRRPGLRRRRPGPPAETEAATRTGGLEVRGLTWTIEGNKTCCDNISMTARPGTLTAIIGASGAGKSTLPA